MAGFDHQRPSIDDQIALNLIAIKTCDLANDQKRRPQKALVEVTALDYFLKYSVAWEFKTLYTCRAFQ